MPHAICCLRIYNLVLGMKMPVKEVVQIGCKQDFERAVNIGFYFFEFYFHSEWSMVSDEWLPVRSYPFTVYCLLFTNVPNVQVSDTRSDATSTLARPTKTKNLFINILFFINSGKKYQYRTKTGYYKCRNGGLQKGIFVTS